MTIIEAILLGIIQGITEFLPISSSAHLVLVPYLFNWQIPAEEAFVFNVLVQVASLVAILAYFWSDLVEIAKSVIAGLRTKTPFQDPNSRTGWFLVLATLPAGLIGLGIKDLVEQAFASPVATAVALFITAGLLVGAERISTRTKGITEINWKDALLIGFAQALAIFPGISRSGSTITGGMLRGLTRPDSARFAFLMAIPVMLAAGLAAASDLVQISGFVKLVPIFIPGLLTSAVVSYLSIRWLLKYLSHKSLYIFAAYCVIFGALALIVSVLR